MDCTENRALCDKYEVKGYPTIQFYDDGIRNDYTGGRDLEGFTNFIEGNTMKGAKSKKERRGKASKKKDEKQSDL